MDFEEKPSVKDSAPELVVGDNDSILGSTDTFAPERSLIGLDETADGDATRILRETNSAGAHTSRDAHTRRPLIKKDEMISASLRIKSKLGKGGMGDVYLAQHLYTKKEVAIKLLAPNQNLQDQRWQRFKQEALVLASLDHPNIIRVKDFGLSDAHGPYMVMEYFDGEPLSSIIERTEYADPHLIIEICSQVADALAYAHSKGIVHRDIKPSNILVAHRKGEAPTVRIVDFGIAKIQAFSESDQGLTQTGQILGSPLYMSPEQCAAKKCDARSDVYSLGCVMYEALTGKAPFIGKTYTETIIKHQEENLQLLNDQLKMPSDLQRIVMRALEKNPADRFQTMAEFKSALAASRKYGGHNMRRVLRHLVQLLCIVIVLMPLAGMFVAKLVVASEPTKAITTISAMNLPRPVVAFLMPNADAYAAVIGLSTAELYYSRGGYRLAEKLLRGHANSRYAELTYYPLAKTLAMQGEFSEAQELLTTMAGGIDLGAARNSQTIADDLIKENHEQQAIPFLRTARDLDIKWQGEDSIEAAENMVRIGAYVSNAGSHREAKENFVRAYNIFKRHPGKEPSLMQACKDWLTINSPNSLQQ